MKIARVRFIQGIVKVPKFDQMHTVYRWRPDLVILCGCMPTEPEPPDVDAPHWWYPFVNMVYASKIPLAVEDSHPAMRMSMTARVLFLEAMNFCFPLRQGSTGGGFLEPQMRRLFDLHFD